MLFLRASEKQALREPQTPLGEILATEEGSVNFGLVGAAGLSPVALERCKRLNLPEDAGMKDFEESNRVDAKPQAFEEVDDKPSRASRNASTYMKVEEELSEWKQEDESHSAEDKKLEQSLDRLARLVASGYAPQLKHMVWLFRALTRDSLPNTLAQRVYDMLMAIHHSFPVSHAPWFVLNDNACNTNQSKSNTARNCTLKSTFVWKGLELHAGEKSFNSETKRTVARLYFVLKEHPQSTTSDLKTGGWKNAQFLMRFYAAVFADELTYLRDMKLHLSQHSLKRVLKDRNASATIIDFLGRYIRAALEGKNEGAFRCGMDFLETFIEVFGEADNLANGDKSWYDAQTLMHDVSANFKMLEDALACRVLRTLRPGQFKLSVLLQLLFMGTAVVAVDPEALVDNKSTFRLLFEDPLCFIEQKCGAICKTTPPRRNQLKVNTSQKCWAMIVCELLYTMQAVLLAELTTEGRQQKALQAGRIARVAMLDLCDRIESSTDSPFFQVESESKSDKLRAKFELARATLFDFDLS